MSLRTSDSARRTPLTLTALCAAAALCAPTGTAFAADSTAAPAPTSTENLARLMLEKKVITPEQADSIIAQSREEAAAARTAAPAPANGATPPKDGTVRVQYVPESVKQQLREDIKQEVMDEAKRDNWAQPEQVPEWTKRFHVAGDLRLRSENRFYADGNDTTGAFPDFNAINRGNPYDASASNPNFAPQRNVDQARDRLILRLRLGADVDLGEDFTAGMRIATGNDASPVTANQSLGQNGGFSKYALWLDRGFLKYEPLRGDGLNLSVTGGRMDNPFFGSMMMWDEDLGFDGFALKTKMKVGEHLEPFVNAGLFPIFNTDLDFATNQPSKFKSDDKWLYAGQIGTVIKATKDLKFTVSGAYYCFENVEGRLSTPFVPLSAADAGDTDSSRPLFAQSGNTYRALRNITPDASNGFGTTNQFQYFGLASPFRVGALTARADYDGFAPVHVSVLGEIVKNFAFDGNNIDAVAVNNRSGGSFAGGDMGYDVTLNFGSAALEKRWDWIVGLGYRYVETDAVPDAFTDSDLGNGGTNLRGYTLSGSLAVAKRVSLRARWFSAESIAGPQFRADTFMFDISARF